MENGLDGPIWRVPYAPGADAGDHPVEVLTFAALRRMDRSGRRRRVQRPEFHVLALVEQGRGWHRADFVRQPLSAGTIAWIRPGVVHQWSDVDAVQGTLVLFTPGAVDAAAADVDRPGRSTWHCSGPEWDLVREAARHLALEHRAAARDPALAADPVLRLLLSALLLRVARTAPRSPGPADAPNEVFRRYRDSVEAHFATRHQVAWHARQLGYGPRTLTRATAAAVGVGAKRFLDERIALEAMRLLAHTDLTVARCAERLGFADPANFTAFFQRHTGTSPTPWRRAESHHDRAAPP